MEISVNYFSVIVAAVASMALGFLWYSPVLFGKPWMKLMGYNEADLKREQKSMGKYYLVSFVLSLVTAYVLSHVMNLSLNFFDYPRLQTGLTSGFWMWLGFIMPVQATNTIFSDKKWALFGINTGYQLATLLIMGVVLGLME